MLKDAGPIEYWHSLPKPSDFSDTSTKILSCLKNLYNPAFLQSMMIAPFQPREIIQAIQLKQIQELVAHAQKIPLYREKFRSVGFNPKDLKTWDDYHNLPITTKDEVVDSFPSCIHPDYDPESLTRTRTSGTSGKVLRLVIDPPSLAVDILQGIRQFSLQSNGRYQPDHKHAMIYSVPWWVDSVCGDYRSVFIDTLLPSQQIANILEEEQPHVLSLNASNLSYLLPYLSKKAIRNMVLGVVHSEMSTKEERERCSQSLGGIPVLDEYSSEELARIALELPCGHYHLSEDSVRLDVASPQTFRPIASGEGLAVATGLLNKAMPLIRYCQGDIVRVDNEQPCSINWRQIEKVQGRVNDSFIAPTGNRIPAGTLLDLTYQWMYFTGNGLDGYVRQFELIQKAENLVVVNLVNPKFIADPAAAQSSKAFLYELLVPLLGAELKLEFNLVEEIKKSKLPGVNNKLRPIRREFTRAEEII